MSALNRLSGFWRLWIVLSTLWVVVVYVEDRFWQRWQLDYILAPIFYPPIDIAVLNRSGGLPELDAPYGRPLVHLIALGAPILALVLAALAVWIARGFVKAPAKPSGPTKQPVDPATPGPSLITEPPSDAQVEVWEKPSGSSSRSRCLLRGRNTVG